MMPLVSNIKRYLSLKSLVFTILAAIASVTAIVGAPLVFSKDVEVYVDNKKFEAQTTKYTVNGVLNELGVVLNDYDYISTPPNSKLDITKLNVIHIKKAVPICVSIDGKEKKIMTYKENVKDALACSTLKVSSLDKIEGAAFNDKVAANMKLKVIRVKSELIAEDNVVPFKRIERPTDRLDKGKENVLVEGTDGIAKNLFKVVYEDGKQVAKELISKKIVKAPIDKLVEVGTLMNFKTSRGDIVRYTKVLDMSATSYTASFADTGKHPGDPGFGITYSGMRARKGIVAVDPRVIPLGTRLYIQCPGSIPDYGFAVAGDIGGAIKGNKIDLYFDDQATVNAWGRKNVKVYIIK